jgi:hypothetical protein
MSLEFACTFRYFVQEPCVFEYEMDWRPTAQGVILTLYLA